MNVLIVDDEQPLRELVSRWLASEGHTILEAHDAESAVTMLEQQPIAVVLCDRSMPGHDGDWLVDQIRDKFPSVAIILATADDAMPARISLREGVLGYLVKPFRMDQVRDAVRDAVVWHQTAASLPRGTANAGDSVDAWLRGRAGRPDPNAKP